MSDAFSEKELAAHIISYLREDGFDVYQEVPFNGVAADIVATRGPLLAVVETKKNLGLDVLEQCCGWLNYANIVYAGVWKPKRSQTTFGRRVAAKYGIGTIEVNVPKLNPDNTRADINIKPEYRRKILPNLRDALRPEMMTGEYGAAGTNRGGRFTPFKQTCEELLRIARAEPGIEIKRAISKIRKHHYSSDSAARVNIKNHIESGIITGLTLAREDGKLVLRPVL